MNWNEKIMKCRRCFQLVLFILCAVFLCSCGDSAGSQETEEYKGTAECEETEEYGEAEAVPDETVPVQDRMPGISPEQWKDVELHEIPEMGYHNSMYETRWYVCWKDILVLGDDIYQKESGTYKRTGETASGLFGEEEIGVSDLRQYHNLMITALCDGTGFILLDLDTWERSEYRLPEGEELDYTCWYIYEGKIYYVKADRLCTWDIEEKTEEEIYVLHDAGKEREMGRFMIRDDGMVMATIHNRKAWPDDPERSYITNREFWKIPPEGQKAATKLWETSKIEFIDWLDFNGKGLFFYGDYHKLSDSCYMCLTEDGEADKKWEYITGWMYFVEDGFYKMDNTSESGEPEDEGYCEEPELSGTISKYDFEGYKVAAYRMLDKKLLEEGYYIKRILCLRDEITVIVGHDETDKLYIRQIQTTDESENVFVNDNFESEWLSVKRTVEGYLVTGHDKKGREVFEEKYEYRYHKKPEVSELTEEIYQIDLEWAVSREEKGKGVWFFNKETADCSEYYLNPLMTDKKYVACMEDDTLVVTDLFRKGEFYMEIKRNFTWLADPADAILNVEMLDENHIKVEYLRGSKAEKTTEVIELENAL